MLYIGWDWGCEAHDVTILDAGASFEQQKRPNEA